MQDIWINNAGYSQRVKQPVAETSAGELAAVVDANLKGALFGSKAAISRMMLQVGTKRGRGCVEGGRKGSEGGRVGGWREKGC